MGGSCPIDFAYRVHTEVGHHTVGAKVNGAIVPLNTPLKTGDVVDILTSKNSAGPSQDWIKIVKSAHARNKIRSFFQKKEQGEKREAIRKGEDMLLEETKKQKLDPALVAAKRLEGVLPMLSFKNLDDLYVAIAAKRLLPQLVLDKLETNRPQSADNEQILQLYQEKGQGKRPVSGCGVTVPGIDTIAVELANCCAPVPGDPIIGYISKGMGVKVHRTDCPNVANLNKRLIPVVWDEIPADKTYDVNLMLNSDDRNFLLTDIVTCLQQSNVAIRRVDSKVDENNLTATTKLTVSVKNADHLRVVLANLKKVRSVNTVERVIV